MNEHKHTPGPWRVRGRGNGRQELPILGPNGEIGCIRENGRLGDAILIAASPELLAGLQRAEFLLQRISEGDHQALNNAKGAARDFRLLLDKVVAA